MRFCAFYLHYTIICFWTLGVTLKNLLESFLHQCEFYAIWHYCFKGIQEVTPEFVWIRPAFLCIYRLFELCFGKGSEGVTKNFENSSYNLAYIIGYSFVCERCSGHHSGIFFCNLSGVLMNFNSKFTLVFKGNFWIRVRETPNPLCLHHWFR